MKTIPKWMQSRCGFTLFAITISIFSDPAPAEEAADDPAEETNVVVTVRHAPGLIGGTVRGSVQQLNGENVTLAGGFEMSGDLLVSGTPSLIVRGKPAFSGTLTGNGSASPTGYKVTLNGNCSLRYLRTRTDPVKLPVVADPAPPKGKRIVCISGRTDAHKGWGTNGELREDERDFELRDGNPCGDATTLRDLLLGENAGLVAVPPGAYGTFIVCSGAGLQLGVPGASTPANYDLQNLILIGRTAIKIVGPVTLTLAHGVFVSGTIGAPDHPSWLQLRLADGGLVLNPGSAIYGQVVAPDGTVIMTCHSKLVGTLASDRLILAGEGEICWTGSVDPPVLPPVATSQSLTLAENTATGITLTGSDWQGRPLTYALATQPAHGTLNGTPPNLTYLPATNYFGSDTFTFKVNNGIADSLPATVSLTVTQIFAPPIALAQQLTNYQNTPLPVTLTGYDPQGLQLNFIVLTSPEHGTLTGTAPNLTYHPDTNYYGNDSFAFKVDDGFADSPATIISITNLPADYPPTVLAGPDQLIILPTNSLPLAGSVSFHPRSRCRVVDLGSQPIRHRPLRPPSPVKPLALFGPRAIPRAVSRQQFS